MILLAGTTEAVEPRTAPEGWERLVESPVLLWIVIALVALAIVVSLWCSWRERHALSPGRWKTTALLRLLAIAALAAGLAGWQRRPVNERVDPSRVVVLVDASASMVLPDGDAPEPTRFERAVATAKQLSMALSETHEIAVAGFGEAVVYVDQEGLAAVTPHSASTSLGDAVSTVLEEHRDAPLAGVVVLSDGDSNRGVAPEAGVALAVERGIPVHTVGFGPTTAPSRVRIAQLLAPDQAYTGDPIAVSLLVEASGATRQTGIAVVRLRRREGETLGPPSVVNETEYDITPDDRTMVGEFEIDSLAPGSYSLEASLAESGQARGDIVSATFEVIDHKTQVLLCAGGPTRDYRFLRDQLRRDDSFEVDVLLQSSQGGVGQDARRVLTDFPQTPEALDGYDALVAFDPDWSLVSEDAQANLVEWVAQRGGGMLLVPGQAHAFAIGGEALPGVIARLAPVTIDNDPLGHVSWDGRMSDPKPVRLTVAGEGVGFLKLRPGSDPSLFWEGFEGFYTAAPKAAPKPGAVVYANLAEQGSVDAPLLVDQYYGAGRVAYLATGETWRLRRVDPSCFVAFHTQLLRRLAQGRQRGAGAHGRLFFDRSQYEVGESITVRLILKGATPANGVKVDALWQRPGGSTVVEALSPSEADPSVMTVSLTPSQEGTHAVSVELPGGDRLEAETLVKLSARESLAVTRDEETLITLAEKTAGHYYDDPDAAYAGAPEIESLARLTPSRAETRTIVGSPDPEFGRMAARASLLAFATLLTIEWALRRLWKLA